MTNIKELRLCLVITCNEFALKYSNYCKKHSQEGREDLMGTYNGQPIKTCCKRK